MSTLQLCCVHTLGASSCEPLTFMVIDQAEAAAAAEEAAKADEQPATHLGADAAEAMDISTDAGAADRAGR